MDKGSDLHTSPRIALCPWEGARPYCLSRVVYTKKMSMQHSRACSATSDSDVTSAQLYAMSYMAIVAQTVEPAAMNWSLLVPSPICMLA